MHAMMLALFLAAALAGPTAPVAQAQPIAASTPKLAGPAVVVLWASWCAQCKAELARLPALARAAAPLPVTTLAIDPPVVAGPLLADRGVPAASAYADGRDPRVVLDGWGGPGAILPVAVAIDATGRVCGRKLGLLGTDQLREWAAACR